MRERLARLDERIARIERQFAASLFLGMVAATSFDVIHRVFSRTPGRLSVFASRWFSDGSIEAALRWDLWLVPAVTLAAVYALAYGAYRTRASHGGKKDRLSFRAAGATIATALGVLAYIRLLPEGMVWAPYFGLSCLLWIGLVGASLATHQGQHLALEMGDKLWPERLRGPVKRTTAGIVASLCFGLAALGLLSVLDHYGDWISAPGAGLIPSIDWPKWLVFSVVPYAFGMMGLRFLGRALHLLPEPTPPEMGS